MMLDWLSDDFPRVPEFVRMLREYERRPVAPEPLPIAALDVRPDPAPDGSHDPEAGFYTPSGWHPADAAFRAYLAARKRTTP